MLQRVDFHALKSKSMYLADFENFGSWRNREPAMILLRAGHDNVSWKSPTLQILYLYHIKNLS